MSIERSGDAFLLSCDFCGDSLPEEWSFDDAVEAKKLAAWKSIKENGYWDDCCPKCYVQMNSAASDFAEVNST